MLACSLLQPASAQREEGTTTQSTYLMRKKSLPPLNSVSLRLVYVAVGPVTRIGPLVHCSDYGMHHTERSWVRVWASPP